MNSAKKPTWHARRAHLRMTAMRRGGMPLPGSLDFGFAARGTGAGTGGVAVAGEVAGEGEVEVEGAVGGDGYAALMASSAGALPGLPVSQGIGSGWTGRDGASEGWATS